MTKISAVARRPARDLFLVVAASAASPALADHPVATGVAGNGSSLNVLSPDTLEQGCASAGLRLGYAKPDRRSDARLEALAGQHVHAHDTDYVLSGALGVAYGLTDRLTVAVELPYVHRHDLRAGEHSHSGGAAVNEVVALGNVSGIGDATVTAKYLLLVSDTAKLALISGLKLPTGNTHRSAHGERLETEHQPGSGSWDLLLGGAFGTQIGRLSLNVSAVHQFAGKGAQRTRLGDRTTGGIALVRRFGPPEHHDEAPHEHAEDEAHEAAAPHGHALWDVFVELTGEWEDHQKIAGEIEEESGGKAVWVSPGARFTSAGGWSVAAGVGLPVWQRIRDSHPDNSYRLIIAVGKGF